MIARLGSSIAALSSTALAWVAVAAATIIVGLLLVVGLQYRTIQTKSTQIGEARADHRSAAQAAEGNEQAAIELARRLSACVNDRALSAEAERQANAALERRVAELTASARREQEERERIYAEDQTCDAWRAALVCDRIAERLRFHPAGPDRAPDRGAGRSAGQSPIGAHEPD